jgi:hypothetical protein
MDLEQQIDKLKLLVAITEKRINNIIKNSNKSQPNITELKKKHLLDQISHK